MTVDRLLEEPQGWVSRIFAKWPSLGSDAWPAIRPKRQPFVIFAHTRSGSYHLVSLLDSHPEIDCYGELLQPVGPPFVDHVAVLKDMDEKWHDPVVRREDYEAFLKQIYARSNSISGYKLIAGQHTPAMVYSIMEPDIKVIYLYRDNILATYSSDKIAKTTGQDRAKSGADIRQAKAEFDPEEFEKRCRTRADRHDLYMEMLKRSRKDFFALEYNEIDRPEVQQDLLAFLGASTSKELQSSYTKRNSSNIVSRFSNPGEVERYLVEMGRPDWAVEEALRRTPGQTEPLGWLARCKAATNARLSQAHSEFFQSEGSLPQRLKSAASAAFRRPRIS